MADITTVRAAAQLGLAVGTLRKLTDSGIFPVLRARGNRTVMPAADILALARRELVGPEAVGARELPVLRVGVAERVEGDQGREWAGFATHLSPQDLHPALSGWWRCDPERVVQAGLMAVTLGHYVVAVLTGINGYDSRGDGRYRFHGTLAGSVTELVTPQQWVNPDAPGADRARLLLGRRLESESGGPVAYVRPGG
ncbi:helix-turn-helix domain-containing protein [Streptomyces odorifer]|uniref:Helix-turn-helix domain-containing protein n=3 Tax=Streptomyces TaxID=1883 RepID=A0A7Y6KJP5_9ACTN|nr:helix-turn-helix domain-containing protein [Streptomyces odorifer]NUV49589.1 helix-turn-helix domain-containing protein [Streptomyces sp. CAI-78]